MDSSRSSDKGGYALSGPINSDSPNESSRQRMDSILSSSGDRERLNFRSFYSVTNLLPEIAEMNKEIKLSTVYQKIQQRFGSYEHFKSVLKPLITSRSRFDEDEFRRMCSILRPVLSSNSINLICKSSPDQIYAAFKSMSDEERRNIAAVIDLLEVAPKRTRFLVWISRQLSYTSILPVKTSVKCSALGYLRKMFGKSSSLYWAFLSEDNVLTIYDAVTLKQEKSFIVDLIHLSASKHSIKFSSEPTKIETIFVPKEPYDVDLWESKALRDEAVPYVLSMPYFNSPLPQQALDASYKTIIAPDFIAVRALLDHRVVPESQSDLLISSLFKVFASAELVNSLYCTIIGLDPDSVYHMKHLIKIVYDCYGASLYRDIISLISSEIRKHSADLSMDSTWDLIESIFTILYDNIESIGPQISHLCSLVFCHHGLNSGKRKDAYNAVLEVLFSHIICSVLKYPSDYKYGGDTNKNQEIIANLLSAIALQAPIQYPEFSDLADRAPSLRPRLENFVSDLLCIECKPKYAAPSKEETDEAVSTIIGIADQHRGSFLHSAKEVMAQVTKNPSAIAISHFVHHLCTCDKM